MARQSDSQVLLDFIERSNKSRSTSELDAVFRQSLLMLGVDMYVFSYVHHQNDIVGHGVSSTYPDDWLNHYISNNYISFDPIYRIGWQRSGIFDWSSIYKLNALSKDERRLMNEASDAGLISGAAASIHIGYGRLIGFGFASSSKQSFARDHLSQLYAMAGQFQLVFSNLTATEAPAPITLSGRQKEVLQWTATGKTRTEIAEILGVTEDTVDDHLRHIYRKLRCNDRVVAVLRAIQIGAISI